ncbi:MAG TPA: DNA ligase D [Nitrososphaeraceae archaeon]|jgi:bifunctional non-homologous end joining protein LigD|nr:DNA ligase D [Nitrososphaeraceae archaeon]
MAELKLSLANYKKKRDFAKTQEPKGKLNRSSKQKKLKSFVVQKHDATRLHYDFRIESESGVLISWAVPKGPSMDPSNKRLAILVEDHPLDYLNFEGVIPRGNYGAGTVIVWDIGTYKTKDTISKQLENGKISLELEGKKLRGGFTLIRTKNKNQWLLIKVDDGFALKEDFTITHPGSVLRESISSIKKSRSNPSITGSHIYTNKREDFFSRVVPMLASPVDKAFNNKQWVFEIKWDGVRAILFKENDKIKLQSRSGNDITRKYPEIVTSARECLKECKSTIIDGEIVVLDEKGIPSFQAHQRRMNVESLKDIRMLSAEVPCTFYAFDVLYYEYKDLKKLSYLDRRSILSQIVGPNDRIKISDYIEEKGIDILKHSKELGLEGIMAKHTSSVYREGVRSRDWLKIKNIKTQDCVVIGYTKGIGNRINLFGSLLLAVYCTKEKKFRFVGHTGSGFDYELLDKVYSKLQEIRIDSMPIDHLPYMNRETMWVKLLLVAEVKFNEWTKDGIMRAPIFLRFREDKKPIECTIEADNPKNGNSNNSGYEIKKQSQNIMKAKISNPNKIYWPKTRDYTEFMKKDLINYYELVSPLILTHLKDRPLSLSRYPDGIYGKSFFHKNWNQSKPDFVKTAQIHSEQRNDNINYLVCNNRESLLWIANLGCIEMHPWYSRINDLDSCNSSSLLYEEKCGLNFPDFIVFDLDPYIYSGKEKKGQEPEYNKQGFRAAVELALDLYDFLRELKISSYVKTSGKSGLHVYVPIINSYPYEQTRNFSELIAKIMISKYPKKVTTEWNTSKRKGKVFFDYNQNSRGKTLASVYSLRPTAAATVSMPLRWKKLDSILPTDFTISSVPQLVSKDNDIWAGVLTEKQNIGEIISKVEQI